MILNINHQIWYKVCRPLRRKYKLSSNCVMVLNGSYVYCKYVKKSFTRYNLLKFCSYYDNTRIGSYITVLVSHGFIIEDGFYRNRQLYCISEKGIDVINDLNESYKRELELFVSLYGISL